MVILTRVQSGHQLASDAAASYGRMCRSAGGWALPITSAYRSTEAQAKLRRGWELRLPGYAFALPPGQSRHEHGEAVDFARACWRWLEANAADHGWRRTNPAEDWHYEYFPDEDHHRPRVTPAAIPAPPTTTTTPEDDEMIRYIARLKGKPEVWIGDLVTRRHVRSERELADIRHQAGRNGIRLVELGEVKDLDWMGDAK